MIAELDAARRDLGEVAIVEWSDTARRDRKAVELRAACGDACEVVIEHTREHEALAEVFHRGGPELPERSDGAYFMLGVEPGSFASISYTERLLVHDILTDWIRANLDSAPWPHVPGESIFIRGQHADVPFEWTLHRAVDDSVALIGPTVHIVGVSYIKPADLEARRQARIVRALDAKVPKLLVAARPNRYSILVVEERDRVMSSPAHVARALRAVAEGRDLPEAIYLVHTTIGDPLAMPLLEGGNWLHEGSDPFRWCQFPLERVLEFNSLKNA
jgi:hypothetical protein